MIPNKSVGLLYVLLNLKIRNNKKLFCVLLNKIRNWDLESRNFLKCYKPPNKKLYVMQNHKLQLLSQFIFQEFFLFWWKPKSSTWKKETYQLLFKSFLFTNSTVFGRIIASRSSRMVQLLIHEAVLNIRKCPISTSII